VTAAVPSYLAWPRSTNPAAKNRCWIPHGWCAVAAVLVGPEPPILQTIPGNLRGPRRSIDPRRPAGLHPCSPCRPGTGPVLPSIAAWMRRSEGGKLRRSCFSANRPGGFSTAAGAGPLALTRRRLKLFAGSTQVAGGDRPRTGPVPLALGSSARAAASPLSPPRSDRPALAEVSAQLCELRRHARFKPDANRRTPEPPSGR